MSNATKKGFSFSLGEIVLVALLASLVIILAVGVVLTGANVAAQDDTVTEVGRGSLASVDLDGLDCTVRKTMQGVDVSCDFEGQTGRFGAGELPSVDRDGVFVAAARDGDDLCVVADSAQGTAVDCAFGYFEQR